SVGRNCEIGSARNSSSGASTHKTSSANLPPYFTRMIVRLFVPGLEAAQELHYLVFGPVTVVAIDCGGNERTVSPICGLYDSNVRIGENFLARLRKNTDEGIVSGVQDESRHGDSVYHVSRGGASIVIDRTSKSAVI